MFDFSYKRSIWISEIVHIWREFGIVLLAGCVFSTPLASKISGMVKDKISASAYEMIRSALMVVLFLACFMRLVVGSYNPFIYFRF